MKDRHDPRNWHWAEGIPESLRKGAGSQRLWFDRPDKRDTRNAEELGNDILARRNSEADTQILRGPFGHRVPQDEQLDFENEQQKGFDA